MKKNIFRLHILILILIFSCNNAQKQSDATTKPSAAGNCSYSRDEKDSAGRGIRVVSEEKFIAMEFVDTSNHSPYRGNDFFKGYLSCVKIDTVLGVYFNFKVYSEAAFQFYGGIKKNNKITFILKSGKAVELSFGKSASGTTNLSSNLTEYSSFARIPGSQAEKLVTEDLERVVISWSKKDEEYMAVNHHIFIYQLQCLK